MENDLGMFGGTNDAEALIPDDDADVLLREKFRKMKASFDDFETKFNDTKLGGA